MFSGGCDVQLVQVAVLEVFTASVRHNVKPQGIQVDTRTPDIKLDFCDLANLTVYTE